MNNDLFYGVIGRVEEGLLTVKNIGEDNIEDVFKVCSCGRLDDPVQREGMEIKRRFLLEMLDRYGPLTKIGYIDGRPVAQILFYPEEILPHLASPRRDIIVIHCAYNPFPEARGRGVGSALITELVGDCRRGIRCLRGRQCRFIVAKPFDTGEGVSLDRFYESNGFGRSGEEMYLEIASPYEPRNRTEHLPVAEDRGRAVLFYNPLCEYSYPFGLRVREFLSDIEPRLRVDLIDEWSRPDESIRRGNQWLTANGVPIKSFWTQREAFRKEVEDALRV